MTRTQWFDTPVTTSPLAAALLNDLEARKPEIAYMQVNVKEPPYNAVGDGIVDDTLAIQTAINALPQTGNTALSGGNVLFPPGWYSITSLNLNGKYNINLVGMGSQQGSPRLVSTAASGTVLSATSANSCRIDGIGIESTNGAFTGTVLDLSKGAGSDTTMMTFRNCQVRATSTSGHAGTLVKLVNATICKFDSCYFYGAGVGVLGRNSAADFSNSHTIQDCLFVNQDAAPIKNPSVSWRIVGNTFEPLRSAVAGAIVSAATVPARSLFVAGNWTGDATASGVWFDVNGIGLVFIGNEIEQCGTGIKINAASQSVSVIANYFDTMTTAVDLTATTSGIQITGNHFKSLTNAMNTNAISHTAALIAGNRYSTVTTPFTGVSFGTGSLVVDSDVGLTRLDLNHIRVSKALNFPSTVSIGNVIDATLFVDAADNKLKFRDPATSVVYGLSSHFITVASAGTIAIINQARVVSVTGTTGITGITAVEAGRQVTLIFAGVLTVTDGGNLKLNGNLTTAAGTTLSLVCDGTDYFETGRSVN